MSDAIGAALTHTFLLFWFVASVATYGAEAANDAASFERQINADLDVMARELAKLAASPGFRGFVRSEIAKSKGRENILELQRFLERAAARRDSPPGLAKFREFTGQAHGRLKASGAELVGYDLYIPVEAHRVKWKGDDDLLVAFAPVQGEDAKPARFIAYSVKTANQVSLDPDRPPEIPVLVIAPEEHESHAIEPQSPVIVKLPRREPDVNSATAPERPVPQGSGNSYVGIKYLEINETKEWWWEGDPEIYLIFGHVKGTDCREGKLFVSEVNRVGSTYNLWSRSKPAKWYFDGNYKNWMFLQVVERDSGYTKLRVAQLYRGINCEWSYASNDDFFPEYRLSRDNFNYNYDYFQAGGLFSQYLVSWRKEH